MKNRKPMLLILFVSVVTLLLVSFTCMGAGKPKLKGTKWQCKEKMFVADAGTMTITHTLVFTTNKDVVINHAHYMPAHPAMYMNEDGSVDMIPARSSAYEDTCTYKVKGKMVILTDKNNTETMYEYKVDSLVTPNPLTHERLIFTPVEAEPTDTK